MIRHLNFNILTIFFFIIYLISGSLIFNDYVVTPDEELHRINGLISLKYIFNLFSIDISNIEEFRLVPNLYDDWRKTYGVLFDLPTSFIQFYFKINTQDIFLIRHYLTFIIFFISNIYFYRLIKNNLKNEKLALLGVFILTTSPRLFSHSFFNSKDILFLSFLIIAVYYCIKLLQKTNVKYFILASIFCAFASNIRIIGIYLPVLTLFFFYFKEENKKKINTLKFFIIFFVYYFGFLYLTWPYLWLNPINNFLLILKESASYPIHWDFKTLYLGNYLNPQNIPWHYFFVWFASTTPISFLLIIIMGVFLFLKEYLKFFFEINFDSNVSIWSNENQKINLFIFLNFFIPIFFVICLNSTLYNGWRHLFFLYPFLIYLSLYGLKKISYYISYNFFRFIILLLIVQISSNILFIQKSHPVQNIYFNFFAKNILADKMPIDYWGLGNKKTIDFLLLKKNEFSISNSSFTPLHYLKYSKRNDFPYSKAITFNGTSLKNKSLSDFIFTNYYYNQNPMNIEKFNIPKNYKSYYKLIIDDLIVNEVFIK